MSDLIDTLAGSAATALLEPHDGSGLNGAERLAVALRVAVLNGDADLAAHYRGRLERLDGGAATAVEAERFPDGAHGPRQTAVLRHVDRITREPRAATPEHLAALRAAGLGEPEIVTLSQLVAFVNDQVRQPAGLRLL